MKRFNRMLLVILLAVSGTYTPVRAQGRNQILFIGAGVGVGVGRYNATGFQTAGCSLSAPAGVQLYHHRQNWAGGVYGERKVSGVFSLLLRPFQWAVNSHHGWSAFLYRRWPARGLKPGGRYWR